MALNRKDIVREVIVSGKALGLHKTDIVVAFGAAVVMHGLDETTNDVDADIPKLKFREVARGREVGMGLLAPMISEGSLDVHPNDIGVGDWVEIDGIRVYRLDLVLEQYKALAAHPQRNPAKKGSDAFRIRRLEKLVRERAGKE